ncbi:Conserved oligomeric Golgi complex subunit 8 [Erysiphe necator]|nr:Conserved oligomeric Golgi complex subunit 8 [Erysiphe necator]
MATALSQPSVADPLYEILVPYFDQSSSLKSLSSNNTNISSYLNHLTSLSLSSLVSEEPQSLSQSKQSLYLSLQALSKRSHNSIISSSTHLSNLGTELSVITESAASLRDSLPLLDKAAIRFSENYNTRSENEALDRRRTALLLSRNVDRISTILELPALLNSTIQSSNQTAISTLNYTSALDLNAHVRRLHSLFPESDIIQSIENQSREAMRKMTSNLILSLKTSSLKLAGAMRLISCLRRISPELDSSGSSEGALGSLFLTCRLAHLQNLLDALEPLRELADQEKSNLDKEKGVRNKWESGQQIEKYLKRYIEIFREQSFAIISMYRSIFLPSPSTEIETRKEYKNVNELGNHGSLQPNSTILSTFSLHLVYIFTETLKIYLPNVGEKSSRDSLLTQVLYCAASLGRLGSDFSMILSFFDQESSGNVEEWAEIIKKHRTLAGRLESMVESRET